MEFLAALIAVMLVQLWGSGAPLHRDDWFLRWSEACARQSGLGRASPLLPVAVISIPVFVVLIVYYGIADGLWGLPKLLLLVLILLFSLGRGDFRKAFESYAQLWGSGDIASARQLLREFEGSGADVPETAPQLHAQARARILYRGFERMFAVLFWFTLAGPALALAYRLAFLYRHRVVVQGEGEDSKVAVALADQVLVLFEWLPARALGISFAVVASIRDGVRAWIDLLWQYGNRPVAYLDAIYKAVSGVDDLSAGERSEADYRTLAIDELRQIQVLLNRALVLWLVFMALLQLVL